jgi:hypothetical protein
LPLQSWSSSACRQMAFVLPLLVPHALVPWSYKPQRSDYASLCNQNWISRFLMLQMNSSPGVNYLPLTSTDTVARSVFFLPSPSRIFSLTQCLFSDHPFNRGNCTQVLYTTTALTLRISFLRKTARENLEDSGISLYLFTHASCQKRKYKDIYLDLLRMLQVRRGDVDVTLKGKERPTLELRCSDLPILTQLWILLVRMNSLLFRLSSNFIEQGATDAQIPSARLTLPQRNRDAQAQGSISACIQPPPPQPLNSTAPCISMPRKSSPRKHTVDAAFLTHLTLAPDAFPPGSACRRRKRRKSTSKPGPLWVPEMEKLVRHKRVRCEAEQENQVPACVPSTATYTYKPAPLTKRFGIFCTGKNSMHRRSGHPTPVKAY